MISEFAFYLLVPHETEGNTHSVLFQFGGQYIESVMLTENAYSLVHSALPAPL